MWMHGLITYLAMNTTLDEIVLMVPLSDRERDRLRVPKKFDSIEVKYTEQRYVSDRDQLVFRRDMKRLFPKYPNDNVRMTRDPVLIHGPMNIKSSGYFYPHRERKGEADYRAKRLELTNKVFVNSPQEIHKPIENSNGEYLKVGMTKGNIHNVFPRIKELHDELTELAKPLIKNGLLRSENRKHNRDHLKVLTPKPSTHFESRTHFRVEKVGRKKSRRARQELQREADRHLKSRKHGSNVHSDDEVESQLSGTHGEYTDEDDVDNARQLNGVCPICFEILTDVEPQVMRRGTDRFVLCGRLGDAGNHSLCTRCVGRLANDGEERVNEFGNVFCRVACPLCRGQRNVPDHFRTRYLRMEPVYRRMDAAGTYPPRGRGETPPGGTPATNDVERRRPPLPRNARGGLQPVAILARPVLLPDAPVVVPGLQNNRRERRRRQRELPVEPIAPALGEDVVRPPDPVVVEQLVPRGSLPPLLIPRAPSPRMEDVADPAAAEVLVPEVPVDPPNTPPVVPPDEQPNPPSERERRRNLFLSAFLEREFDSRVLLEVPEHPEFSHEDLAPMEMDEVEPLSPLVEDERVVHHLLDEVNEVDQLIARATEFIGNVVGAPAAALRDGELQAPRVPFQVPALPALPIPTLPSILPRPPLVDLAVPLREIRNESIDVAHTLMRAINRAEIAVEVPRIPEHVANAYRPPEALPLTLPPANEAPRGNADRGYALTGFPYSGEQDPDGNEPPLLFADSFQAMESVVIFTKMNDKTGLSLFQQLLCCCFVIGLMIFLIITPLVHFSGRHTTFSTFYVWLLLDCGMIYLLLSLPILALYNRSVRSLYKNLLGLDFLFDYRVPAAALNRLAPSRLTIGVEPEFGVPQCMVDRGYSGLTQALVYKHTAKAVLNKRIASSIDNADLQRFILGEVSSLVGPGGDVRVMQDTAIYVYQQIVELRFVEKQFNVGSVRGVENMKY